MKKVPRMLTFSYDISILISAPVSKNVNILFRININTTSYLDLILYILYICDAKLFETPSF